MTTPGLDPASPYFSSLAGQVSGGTVKNRGDKRKERVVTRSFDRLVGDELDHATESERARVPERLAHLPPERVLEALLDDVHSSGDTLKGKQTPETILAYKDAVRSFVGYIVDRAFGITETTSGGNILKRKKFTQVQVIDAKLEELARGILSNQKNQLAVLERIEEINGLLVDLMS